MGYSPWGLKESHMTEHAHVPVSICKCLYLKASERKKRKTEKCKVLAVVVSRMVLIKSVELRPPWAHQAGLKCTFSISWALACLSFRGKGWGLP